jgi:protein tyrosine phosphatase (PTP) superfamily phosphohydrolase (DUF442 family)
MSLAARHVVALSLAAGVAFGGCAPAPSRLATEAPSTVATSSTSTPRVTADGPFTDAGVRTLLPTLLNAASPTPDIVTGGQIDAAGLSALRREGVRTVLDLRGAGESRGFDEAAFARGAGLVYVSLPVTTPETLDDRMFETVRALLSDEEKGPFLVHCASGNRVGAALIPHLILDRGLSVDSALTAARRGGLRSEPMTRKALEYVERQRMKTNSKP